MREALIFPVLLLSATVSAVAATAASSAAHFGAPSGTDGMKVVHGPGGEEIIELAMPNGFKTIRLPGLGGMPVAGWPVKNAQGMLNPDTWKKQHGDVPELDDFSRLFTALFLRSQPKLLQGREFAEKFARENLVEQTKLEFFPFAKNPASTRKAFGTNEFDRNDLYQVFLERYETPLSHTLPGVPFDFTFIEQVFIGRFDEASKTFPVSNQQGGSGTLTLQYLPRFGPNRIVVEMPNALPMEPGEARALLSRLPDDGYRPAKLRKVFLGMRLSITGFSADQYGRWSPQVQPLAVALYEDQLLTRKIREFPVKKKDRLQLATVASVPLRDHYVALYAMRDIGGFLRDETILERSKWLIEREQWLAGREQRGTACRDKRTLFEWATAEPELAEGPLLDVLMDPAPDWSFLNDITRFGLTPDHCVGLLLFPRAQIEGRQPEFAAADLAPIYRKSIEAAINKLPKTTYLTVDLPKPKYDFGKGELFFEGKSKRRSRSSEGEAAHLLPIKKVKFFAPGKRAKKKSIRAALAPKEAEGLAFYNLGANKEQAPLAVTMQPKSLFDNSKPGDEWRSSLTYGWGDHPNTLAVDRRLELPRITMDSEEAEQLISATGRRKALRAVIEVEVEKAYAVDPDQPGILFANLRRVLIITHDGQQVAELDAAAFPDAVATYNEGRAAAKAAAQATEKTAVEKRAVTDAQRTERLEGLRDADIVDIRLGMSLRKAEEIIRRHMDVGWAAELSDQAREKSAPNQPYSHFRAFIRADGGEQIALFWPPDGSDRIVAVTRTLRLPAGASDEELRAQLIRKYGDPIPKKKSHKLVWTVDFGLQPPTKRAKIDDAYRLRQGTCRTQLNRWRIRDLRILEGTAYEQLDAGTLNAMVATTRFSVYGGRSKKAPGARERVWDPARWDACGPMVIAEIRDISNKWRTLSVGIHDLAEYAPYYADTLKKTATSADIKLKL